jgi:hypothetical protein
MLNSLKIMREVERELPGLYAQLDDETNHLQELFGWLQKNQGIIDELRAFETFPRWNGPVDATFKVERQPHPYEVCATDGSQIYPDKHQGVLCYVLNTGIAHFLYGADEAQVRLDSVPQLVTQRESLNLSEDIVNAHRALLELEVGLQQKRMKEDVSYLFLCDGSLTFWYLDNKSAAIKEQFFKGSLELLEEFYRQRIPCAGYISMPKSKELMGLLRACISQKKGPIIQGTCDMIVDTDLVRLFLPEQHRTTVFYPTSPVILEYAEHLRPCFVYLSTESEIARIEVPSWVAADEQVFARVLQIISDQVTKGNGYPVSLSEAHEQAVIKGHDRDFFFQILSKMNVRYKRSTQASQKSLKKRFVSV